MSEDKKKGNEWIDIQRSEESWFNFKTQQMVPFTGIPENLKDFIPQTPASLSLYDINIRLGMTPVDAFIDVLRTHNKKG